MKIHIGDDEGKNLGERQRIGQRLSELRKKQGITQEELANLCGVNRVNISKIEKGAYNVSIDILSKIAFALGCAVEVKVNKSIKAVHFSERKSVKLIVGNEYYVSFGNNEAKRCKLLEIIDEHEEKRILIEIVSPRGNTQHIIYADEIGTTPEEAVMNEVTL